MKKLDVVFKRKFLTNLGARIAKGRIEMNISQEELADKADLDRTYISGIERGKRNISVYTLIKISNALDKNITEFLNDDKK